MHIMFISKKTIFPARPRKKLFSKFLATAIAAYRREKAYLNVLIMRQNFSDDATTAAARSGWKMFRKNLIMH